MKSGIVLIISFLFTFSVFGQQTDTITFYSDAFKAERSIYVKIPEFYKYSSNAVRFPVIYLLDGQQEWFVNGVLNNIEHLQYTHEIPQVIVVIIPLVDSVKECKINELEEILPLHTFITEEINEELKRYHPGNYRMIIGHSFSPSFSLYSYVKSPDFYSAVIAHSPLDNLEKLITVLENNKDLKKSHVFISTGNIPENKNYKHGENYNVLKAKYPAFFKDVNLYEANDSVHNAVPIVAETSFFAKAFIGFNGRFNDIAKVDTDYKILKKPLTVKEEEDKVLKASMLEDYFYPPEIAELNGLASRYLSGGYNYHAIRLYEMGIKYYPNYYGFYLSLYELLMPIDAKRAKLNLEKAELLLQQMEPGTEDNLKLLQEIKEIRKKNRW